MDKVNHPNQIRLFVLLLFIAAVACSRVFIASTSLFGSFSNFSPVGAMALFGGAYFSRYKAFAFPLLALWLGDVFLNRFVFYDEWRFFYEGFYWTYGAFALMVLIGKWLMREKTFKNFLLSSLLIVFIHWIVTDFGVWIGGTMYPKSLAGFWTCLVAAIPFERNLLIGTLVYGVIMFGSFEWMGNRFRHLKEGILQA